MSEEHIPDLCTSESVDIFYWIDALYDSIPVYVRWEGSLDDESVDLAIL